MRRSRWLMAGLWAITNLNVWAASEASFTPYQAGEVPENVTDLWKDYDPRAEELEVKVLKEWKEEGVVTRYITFKVGTFKGVDARIAAYFCFPDNGKKNPAFVWCHGGGQRADKSNGRYFARQGFATIDINWLGREMEKGIEENTDWGKMDPTQGPKFYPKAYRKHWKRNLQPDEHTIDPVPSPRNNNWFLLVVAAKRAITLLEQQPEVNAERIGIAGFSMGGTVTAMTAMDPRIQAAAPFVGGAGFLHVDFPGGAGGPSIAVHYRDPEAVELYSRTVDPAAYWPHVTAPVMFLSSVNDFHAAFDRIFPSMALLPHRAWRVSANIHENHGPGPEQWILLIKWFNLHLKGMNQAIPLTPPSTLVVNGETATFAVTPEDRYQRLVDTEIYYSYDPNPLTRFWHRADGRPTGKGNGRVVDLAVQDNLPLYVFALCRYRLEEGEVEARHGRTSTLVVSSIERAIIPENVDLAALAKLKKTPTVDGFGRGYRDWAVRQGGKELATYKFQSPYIDRSNGKELSVSIDPKERKLKLQLRAESKFLGRGRDLGSFSFSKSVQGDGPQDVRVDRLDFKGKDDKELKWSSITRFFLSIADEDSKARIDLTSGEGRELLKSIDLIDAKAEGRNCSFGQDGPHSQDDIDRASESGSRTRSDS